MTSPSTRSTWVDMCKGLAIVMVALHHAVMAMDAYGLLPDLVTYVNYSLNTFRMPLLLLASGIFAARTLVRPWRTVLHKRVAHFSYLYAVWAVLYLLFSLLVPDVHAEAEPGAGLLLSWLVAPNNGLWFLYGLAVFTVVVKLAWRVPLWIQVVVAAALAVVAAEGAFDAAGFAWGDMAQYFVFFLLGVRWSEVLRSTAERASWVSTVLLGTAAASAWGATAALDLHEVPGVPLVWSGCTVAAVISACRVLDGAGVRFGLPWLGARTLPVYLLHALWITLLSSPLFWHDPELSTPVALVVLALGTALVVVLSLVSHRVLLAARASWLFQLPRAWAWTPPSAAGAGAPLAAGAGVRGGR